MQHVKLKKVLAKLKPQSKKQPYRTSLNTLRRFLTQKKVEAAAYYFTLFSVGGSGA